MYRVSMFLHQEPLFPASCIYETIKEALEQERAAYKIAAYAPDDPNNAK